jgi:hypothetical protein
MMTSSTTTTSARMPQNTTPPWPGISWLVITHIF